MVAGPQYKWWKRRRVGGMLSAGALCLLLGSLWGSTALAEEDQDPQEGQEVQEVQEGPEEAPEVPDDEWMEEEGEEPDAPSQLDGPTLPTRDLEAPEDADPEFEAQLEAYREAVDRYSEAIEQYQQAIENLVQTEFDRRMAEIDERYDPRIFQAQEVEREQREEAIASLEAFLEDYPNDPQLTPDAIFRLAILFDQQEEDQYETAQDEYFDALDEWEEEREGDRPQAPQRSYAESQPLFESLIEDWPEYRGLDLAYYFLAHIEWEQEAWEASRDYAAALIEENPESDFVSHAWLMIGEYYFENAEKDGPDQIRDNLMLALDAFEEAGSARGREQLTDANYVRVIYSWAWAHYRLENYPEAIDIFRDVVLLIDELAAETGEERELLREDALAHLAEILAMEDWDLAAVDIERDTVMNRVEEYLNEGDDFEHDVLVMLGEELMDYRRYEEAIEVYEYVLELDPLHPDNPEIHAQVVASLHRSFRDEEAFEVRRQMIDYYGEGSAWHEHQHRQGNEAALRAMDQMVRDYLLMAATWFHEQAQTTRNEALVSQDSALLENAQEQYRTASGAYREFLEHYPNDPEIYQWNFYFAETLFYSEQYREAFDQYKVVRELDIPDNPFQETSAYNAVQALEFLIREEVERGNLSPRALGGADLEAARDEADEAGEEREIDEDAILEQVEVEGIPIPELVREYVTNIDRYVVLGLENEQDPYLHAKFAFQAAKVFHDFEHYDESRTRFEWVVDNFSDHEVAFLAGSLILESYRRENDFEGLTEWAERLEGVIEGEQAEAVRAEIREFRMVGMFRAAEEMMEEERYEEAAREFHRLAREAPDHALAPRALNNAAGVSELINDYDQAISYYEELFTEYPEDPLSQRAVYRVAVNSEWLFDFDRSVRHYELFYNQFEGPTPEELEALGFDIEENREEALLQSAQMNEYLQRYERSAEAYEEYAETYSEGEYYAETLWLAAQTWEKAGRQGERDRLYDRFEDEFGEDPDYVARIFRIKLTHAREHEEADRQAQADSQYEAILELYADWHEDREEPLPGDAEIREAAAESRFMLAERKFEEWDSIRIEGTLQQQQNRLQDRLDGIDEVQSSYREVIDFGNLDWNLAAYFRIGNMLHRMADALFDVPNPFDEGTDEYWVYQDTLDDLAFPLEDNAVQRYEQVIAMARQHEIVNEWTQRALEEIHEYEPSDYPFYVEEQRPYEIAMDRAVPLLSYGAYQRRLERRDWRDQQEGMDTIEPEIDEEVDDPEEFDDDFEEMEDLDIDDEAM